MNKLEYLNQLETILKKQLNKADVDDIIRDYAEFFEEGRRQGESDQEIAAKLGSPELIAQQIMEENGSKVAITPVLPKKNFKFDFKLPKFKWPKFKFGAAEEHCENPEEEICEKKIDHKNKNHSALGCLGSGLLMLMKFCGLLVVGCVLAFIFGMAAIGVGCGLVGLLCAFAAVIIGFVAASLAAHFLTLPVTLLAIFLCISLLALIICLGTLLIMLMLWCGKTFLWLLRGMIKVPAEKEAAVCEVGEEGELYE